MVKNPFVTPVYKNEESIEKAIHAQSARASISSSVVSLISIIAVYVFSHSFMLAFLSGIVCYLAFVATMLKIAHNEKTYEKDYADSMVTVKTNPYELSRLSNIISKFEVNDREQFRELWDVAVAKNKTYRSAAEEDKDREFLSEAIRMLNETQQQETRIKRIVEERPLELQDSEELSDNSRRILDNMQLNLTALTSVADELETL